MDFWQTILVVRRRWYIALPALILSVAAAVASYALLPVQYLSNSVLVLVAPPTGPTDYDDPNHPNPITNPLLDFGQGQTLSASILIEALSAPNVAEELGVTATGGTTYQVGDGSSNAEIPNSGPFVFVQGTSSSPAAAQDIVRRVDELASKELADRQDKLAAPASTHISVVEVVAPTMPTALKGSKLRAGAAAGALCIIASLAVVFAIESVSTWRRRRDRRTIGRSEPIQVRAASSGSDVVRTART